MKEVQSRDLALQRELMDQIETTNENLTKHSFKLDDFDKKISFVNDLNRSF